MNVSCAFATSPATSSHIAVAERLGYHRAWCYDSPALLTDVWMALALAGERTSTIGLRPAVLVPSLRHPMVNAAGTVIDDVDELTGERVMEAAGHGVAVVFHAMYERAGAAGMDALPGARRWREAVERVPQERRHLAIHEDTSCESRSEIARPCWKPLAWCPR